MSLEQTIKSISSVQALMNTTKEFSLPSPHKYVLIEQVTEFEVEVLCSICPIVSLGGSAIIPIDCVELIKEDPWSDTYV